MLPMNLASPCCSPAPVISNTKRLARSVLHHLRIATRESALALWQANHVAAVLRDLYPRVMVSLVPMTTKGDQILDQPLSKIGGKGLFLKELEVAMLEGRADMAVHSLKDVPMVLEQEFCLAAVMQREQPFDAFASNQFDSLQSLPPAARVGTSSLRRQVQLRQLRPDLNLVDLRGNVQTRLRKLDEGQFDAIILAAAGLERLELGSRIRSLLSPPDMLPAAGQGALGLECLASNEQVKTLLAPLADAHTWICVRAERAFAKELGGSCQMPIAAFASLERDTLTLSALVGDAQAETCIQGKLRGVASAPEQLGIDMAAELRQRDAGIFATHAAAL
jgi:hydroxymethylbilane synthase